MPKSHHNPLFPYTPSKAPELDLHNSPRLENLIREGKLYITLQDAIALALENNLDIAYARYYAPLAQTDILRTKAGSPAQGVNASVTQSTQGGFSGSSGGGGGGGASAAAGAGGIVTSTLGAGANVPSFDPSLTFQGYVDHTVVQEANQFLVGVPILKTNTIKVLSTYNQSFALGTNVQVNYLGERVTSNSPYNAINPDLYSNFCGANRPAPARRIRLLLQRALHPHRQDATPRSPTSSLSSRSLPPSPRSKISTGISSIPIRTSRSRSAPSASPTRLCPTIRSSSTSRPSPPCRS